jgi:hypothetical protein
MKPLAAFCDRIGYRHVVRQATWGAAARRGGALPFDAWIENTGVAPGYRKALPALRVRSGRGEVVIRLASDVRTWLPGDVLLAESVRVPRSLPAGSASLALGLLAPGSDTPYIRFANEGWLPLGSLRLR